MQILDPYDPVFLDIHRETTAMTAAVLQAENDVTIPGAKRPPAGGASAALETWIHRWLLCASAGAQERREPAPDYAGSPIDIEDSIVALVVS